MFESAVAAVLNRFLGKYVQDLDLENLNVGIIGGNVVLENLILKPESLYQLGLPIIVKVGTITKLNLNIPWKRISSQASVINIEDIFVLVSPVTDGHREDWEKLLLRAEKKWILEELENVPVSNGSSDIVIENIITSVLNNLRIYVHNVHLRYEDAISDANMPVAFGLCIHNFIVGTTNSKWKSISHSPKMGPAYQIVKIESLSCYCNANCSTLLSKKEDITTWPNTKWISCMKKSLETFSIDGDPLDFILKPISARLKLIVNKGNEAQVPRLLVDFVLQDAELQLSHKQYLGLVQLCKSFRFISINRLFTKFHPNVPVYQNAKKWWRYAFDSVVHCKIRPYTWKHVFDHRETYRAYCKLYKQMLLSPSNIEIKFDLQHIEDKLDIVNLVLAREQTKLELLNESYDAIEVKEVHSKWWFNFGNCNSKRKLFFMNDKSTSIWNMLTVGEKSSLYKWIGFTEKDVPSGNKPKQYVEYKFNFTIANCCLTLLSGGCEIMAIGLSHILSSIETRPSAKAFKFSLRIENIVVEGASVEYNLIPIITSDKGSKDTNVTNVFSLDFEKNPLNNDTNYILSLTTHPLGIIYHEFSYTCLLSFLQTATFNASSITSFIMRKSHNIVNAIVRNMLSRMNMIQLNIDLKLPYIVIPEYGSLSKSGNISVLDFGQLQINNDLQSQLLSNLDSITQLELEEKLYDRFYMSLKNCFIYFYDNDEDWKNFRTSKTDFALIKFHSDIVFSNNIKPEYRQLPRNKLNVTIQTLRISISDNKIVNLLSYVSNIPKPMNHTVFDTIDNTYVKDMLPLISMNYLRSIQYFIAEKEMESEHPVSYSLNKEEAKNAFLNVDKSGLSSEVSDEDSEMWARILDLPGFDDNVSPNNVILSLFRLYIVKVSVNLKRSRNNVDKPYIILNMLHTCCDLAIMEYGPAVQISVKSIDLTDKLHAASSSSHSAINLLSANGKPNVITVLYRKVRSNCPDFRSYFHSVEQSLVIDIDTILSTFHRDVMIDLFKYLKYCWNRLNVINIKPVWLLVKTYREQICNQYFRTVDPPVPPGATKFSYSARLSKFEVTLTDKDIDFLVISINGFEIDRMFKANERHVFRMYLQSINVDDISNVPVDPKVILLDGDKFLELKYVRHSTKLKKIDVESNQDNVKSDGKFKFYLGNVHFVYTYRLFHNLQKYFNQFMPTHFVRAMVNKTRVLCLELMNAFHTSTAKIHMSVELHFPTLFLPLNASSPYLIVINTGTATAENFFIEHVSNDQIADISTTDNLLVNLDSFSMSKAIVNINGSTILQETIIEPFKVSVDIKRLLSRIQEVNSAPALDINIKIDEISAQLGQKNLTDLYIVWNFNIKQLPYCFNLYKYFHIHQDEAEVQKLEAFLNQKDTNQQQFSVSYILDGFTIVLYNDLQEILSSPIREESQSLCKLKTGEIIANTVIYADGRSEMQISFQNFLLTDTRVFESNISQTVLQSYGSTTVPSNNENVSVTVPPVLSVTRTRSQTGEKRCSIMVDHFRLNLNMSFIKDIFKYFEEAIPYLTDEQFIDGFVNYGYVDEDYAMVIPRQSTSDTFSLLESADSYNQVKLTYTREELNRCPTPLQGFTLTLLCRKPEIMLCCQLKNNEYYEDHALLFRFDLSLEMIEQLAHFSLNVNATDLHVLSKRQSKLIKTAAQLVMHPCDVDISLLEASVSNKKKATFSVVVSKIDMHLSANILQTFYTIVTEYKSFLENRPLNNRTEETSTKTPTTGNIWKPTNQNIEKIVNDYDKAEDEPSGYILPDTEIIVISTPKVSLIYEIEDIVQKKPVLFARMSMEIKFKRNINDICFETKGDFSVQCSYFNFKKNAWEPLIEPVERMDNIYRPWELSIKVFQSDSHPVSMIMKDDCEIIAEMDKKEKQSESKVSASSCDSDTTDNENDLFTLNDRIKKKILRKKSGKSNEAGSDFDSEFDNAVIEQLKKKFQQLLTRSNFSDSSGDDTDSSTDDEQNTNNDLSMNRDNKKCRPIFSTKGANPSLYSPSSPYTRYLLVESRDRFELVFTTETISMLKQIFNSYYEPFSNLISSDAQLLSLHNDITPFSTVVLTSELSINPTNILMYANYRKSNSCPSSLGSIAGSPVSEMFSETEFDLEPECFEGEYARFQSAKTDHNMRKVSDEIAIHALQFPQLSMDNLYGKVTERKLHINIEGFKELQVICPTRQSKKIFRLESHENHTKYHVTVSIEYDIWGNSITVRSPLQMKNETCFPLGLYYKLSKSTNTKLELFGESTNPFDDTYRFAVIQPDELYNIPLVILYHCRIHILPSCGDYQLSESTLWWENLSDFATTPVQMMCRSKEDPTCIFCIKVISSKDSCTSDEDLSDVPNYLVRFVPAAVVQNFLPCPLRIKIPTTGSNVLLEAGSKICIYSIDLESRHDVFVEAPKYLDASWTGQFCLSSKSDDKVIPMKTDSDDNRQNKHFHINLNTNTDESSSVIFYSSYWFVNKTGLPLQLKGSSSDMIYETFEDELLFFTFRRNRKRTIRIKIYESSWSSDFYVDTTLCPTLVVCWDEERNREYSILVETTLSKACPQLTKIVTLLPYYIISNNSCFPLRYMEENEKADLWLDLPENQTTQYWPETSSSKMYVRLKNGTVVSPHFCINKVCKTVFRLDNEKTLVVDVTGGQYKPFLLAFRRYKPGDIPVKIVNGCESYVKITQKGVDDAVLLSPGMSAMLTWFDPTCERTFLWSFYQQRNKEYVANISMDGYGQELVNFEELFTNDSSDLKGHPAPIKLVTQKTVYWVSFMHDVQRMFLLTDNEVHADRISARIDSETSKNDYILSLKGIGISLVDEHNGVNQELAYISINDSSPVWEMCVAHHWQMLPLELATWIENQWSQGLKRAQLKSYLNVDLSKMQITKPFHAEVRRTYHPAVWIHCRNSLNAFYYRWRLHNFQVDNHLPNSKFQTVIFPSKSNVDSIRKYGLKPCSEGVILKTRRQSPAYKSVKITIQEFNVQVDQEFMLSLCQFLLPLARSESFTLKFGADICKVHQPLSMRPQNVGLNSILTDSLTDYDVSVIIEYMYISPLKIQLTCHPHDINCMRSSHFDPNYYEGCLLYVISFLNKISNDDKIIPLKSKFWEESQSVANQNFKIKQLLRHYWFGLMQQVYSKIGRLEKQEVQESDSNRDDRNVEFYYGLPFSFTKTSDEVAEAISESIYSMLAYITQKTRVCGPPVLSCAKKTSLDLGLNTEVIRRKSIPHQYSSDEPDEILIGDQCFEIGVLYGLSGVSMKSTTRKQEGLELFFHTHGRQLLRLLNNYADTLSNLPDAVIDGLKRAAESEADIVFRRRLTRNVNLFGLKPYSLHNAIGLNILNLLNNGAYSKTDEYWAHTVLTSDGKCCLLITLQHVLYITKNGLWTNWTVDWSVTINNILEVPQLQIEQKQLILNYHMEASDGSIRTKIIEHNEVSVLIWIQKMIESVFIISLENKPYA